ncbi:hypothetical protein LMH87_003030 [Akanthomyces muscarius]|uniref:Uncharacterized protein n=1 Tax=Akanthomyces muscarius TaxID=2231603 RepID=A0A9W8UHL9_AKAMU|nr:hypothetical protein LMH87_003030 [Akanthomyces muscarius]KAJ4148566.1 hypothetical protein LMH87_003030 [Akanthomyces muscarius]
METRVITELCPVQTLGCNLLVAVVLPGNFSLLAMRCRLWQIPTTRCPWTLPLNLERVRTETAARSTDE